MNSLLRELPHPFPLHVTRHLALKALTGLLLFLSSFSVTLAQEYPPVVNYGGIGMSPFGGGGTGVGYMGNNGVDWYLYIESNGYVYLESTDYYASGTYDFNTGVISVNNSEGSSIPLVAVYSTGEPWFPLAASAHYGPASFWVDGSVYSWISTTLDSVEYGAPRTDHYSDGDGHVVSFYFGILAGGAAVVQGTTPSDVSFSGSFYGNVYESADGNNTCDVRAADSGGNPITSTAPSGLPPALKVGGDTSLWHYLGMRDTTSGYYVYAGILPGQRLVIDSSNNVFWNNPWEPPSVGYYADAVIIMQSSTPKVQIVEPDGTLDPPNTTPAVGPPAVWVNSTLWRYAGTGNGNNGTPSGDIYLGSSEGQQLVIDSQGKVAIINLTSTATGWYISPSGSLPGLFLVQGMEVLPGDTDSSIYHQNDALFGPLPSG